MTSFSDTQEISCLFDSCDGHIEQVQHVLRVNHVPFGTPFDFLILAQTLEHNSQLRTDLTVLLQSFVEGEKKMTHRTALGIIAVASGGSNFTPSANGKSLEVSGMSKPVNVLVDLLMSVGGRVQATAQNSGSQFDGRPHGSSAEPINSEIPQTPPLASSSSNHETSLEQLPGLRSKDRDALEAVPTSSHLMSDLDSSLNSQPQDPQPETALPHSTTETPLAETLTRLELNALQVKHYLDSIDQRISRIEPRLDALPTYHPSLATTPPVSGSGQVSDGRYSTLLAIEPHQAPELQKARQEPSPLDPAHRQSIPSDMPALLRSSSRLNHSRKKFEIPIITAAALVLLLLLFWGFSQNTQPLVTGPANPSLPQTTTIPTSALANHGNTSQPSEGAQARPSASHSPATAKSQEVHHRPLHSSTLAGLHVPPSSTTPTPVTSAHPDESSVSTLDVQPVNVSSGVMAGNILSAPQPTYPRLASLTRMRGEVVMQAIISKDGTIENVHVIKGHRLLRGAATNAVRTWRYRPYLVDGRPVEVATTVSVDFNQAQ